MSDAKCHICSTRAERAPQVIFENEHWLATLSANQGYLGTLFIELNGHKEALSELSDAEWSSFAVLCRQVEAAEKRAFGAVMFNWSCLMNNFYKTLPAKPHVHWHVRPRYDKDVVIGDHTLVDPNFGHHYDKAHLAHISPALKVEISERLQGFGRI